MDEPKKVGRYYPECKKEFNYNEVHYKDGWADAKKYLPRDFDLVALKLKSGITRMGWSNGNTWDGAKLTDAEKPDVLYWKKKEYD